MKLQYRSVTISKDTIFQMKEPSALPFFWSFVLSSMCFAYFVLFWLAVVARRKIRYSVILPFYVGNNLSQLLTAIRRSFSSRRLPSCRYTFSHCSILCCMSIDAIDAIQRENRRRIVVCSKTSSTVFPFHACTNTLNHTAFRHESRSLNSVIDYSCEDRAWRTKTCQRVLRLFRQ